MQKITIKDKNKKGYIYIDDKEIADVESYSIKRNSDYFEITIEINKKLSDCLVEISKE